MAIDLTPQYDIIPFKEKVQVLDNSLGESIGGLSMNSASLRRGQGSEVFKVDAQGIYIGNEDFASAPFSVTMAGVVVATSITLTGGTIKFGKTSFADTVNAGYHISSSGFYFGSANDASFVKYNIGTGTLSIIADITAGDLTNSFLNTNSVDTAEIVDLAIETAKLNDLAVSEGKIAALAVTTAKIDNLAVTNAKINSLAVSKLTAGTITSQAITLAVDASGDAKIQAGKTDFTNTESGFILGIDDSDSDLAKFYIGDANKFFNWNGADVDMQGTLRVADSFTAGENLTDADVVCIKNTVTDYSPSDDARVDEDNATTNYGTTTTLNLERRVSAPQVPEEFFIQWNLGSVASAEDILKAEVIFTVQSSPNANEATLSIVDSGAGNVWIETGTGEITWNNKPADGTQSLAELGCEITKTFSAAGDKLTYDVTQIVRQWKAGNIDNNGFRVTVGSTNNGLYQFDSKESGVPDDRPILRITELDTTDSKVYKANCDDYNLSRVKGIVKGTVTSGNSAVVFFQGIANNLSGLSPVNKNVYLNNTAGSYVTSQTNLNRVISIGEALSATEMLIDIQRNDIFIQNTARGTSEIGSFTGGATQRFYAPDDASYCVVDIEQNTGEKVRESILVKRDNDGQDSKTITKLTATGASITFTVTWTSNYIEITADQAYKIQDIYYYS